MTARLAVLASGNGSNLQALLDACGDGHLDAAVVAVVSDRPDARALERARRHAVASVVALPPDRSMPRHRWDAALADVVGAVQPDWVVLAGFMRLLSSAFLDRFPGRVVNLHPALPGELPGTRAIERALEEASVGVRTRTGVMVHLVPDEGVDDGPVLATVEVPIHADDDLASLSARMHAAEHDLLVTTLARLVTAPREVLP
jgi:phosphoribosylglycinamide formyltransferase-1